MRLIGITVDGLWYNDADGSTHLLRFKPLYEWGAVALAVLFAWFVAVVFCLVVD